MPTVGWIREDALEAFYSATERIPEPGPPAAPVFHCPFCAIVSASRTELQEHVAEAHRVERPALLIRGREPPNNTVIRTSLPARSLLVANATSARIGLNGATAKEIPVNRIASVISSKTQAEVLLELSNGSLPRAAPVTTTYEIRLRIADVRDLKKVEQAFSEIIVTSEISREAIGRFLDDRRSRDGGKEYATGLAEYALGVLLKERPDTEMLTTPVARYRESYSSALERLVDFERPLARLLSAVIRFATNDFSRTTDETGFWELDLATALLKDPDRKRLPPSPGANVARQAICPIDHGTGQILALADRMVQQLRWSPILDDECRKVANSEVLDAIDRQKAMAIWAVAAWRLGAKRNAVEPLRQISATYPFRSWAEPYLESMTK